MKKKQRFKPITRPDLLTLKQYYKVVIDQEYRSREQELAQIRFKELKQLSQKKCNG